MGAIIGGAAGGGVALIAVILGCLCLIRRKRLPTQKHHPVDLLQDPDEEFGPRGDQLPQFYRPEPFQVPNATAMSSRRQSYDPHQSIQASTTTSLLQPGPDMAIISVSHGHQGYDSHRSPQTSTTTSLLQSGTPNPHGLDVGPSSGSGQTRKSPMVPEQLRPVNIIHHDDAGIIDEADHILETIELPPAYNNIRNNVAR